MSKLLTITLTVDEADVIGRVVYERIKAVEMWSVDQKSGKVLMSGLTKIAEALDKVVRK